MRSLIVKSLVLFGHLQKKFAFSGHGSKLGLEVFSVFMSVFGVGKKFRS